MKGWISLQVACAIDVSNVRRSSIGQTPAAEDDQLSLTSIRSFYLITEEEVNMTHPVRHGYALRSSRPLHRYLRYEDVPRLLGKINDPRDRAIFMLMLRCGLRVAEVAKLTLETLDLPRSQLFVYEGKGMKDRVVYLNHDAQQSLLEYLKMRTFMAGKKALPRGKRTVGGQTRHVDPVVERRCRSGDHPGSSGAISHKE